MRAPASFLFLHRSRRAAGERPPSPGPQRQEIAPTMAVDSDAVVILASLVCMLVCVLGLTLLSRCVSRRRRRASSSPDRRASPPPPKGLGTEAIDVLPTISFAAAESSSSECAICLAEFAQGEGVRVLPPCGHGFHLACIDAWLRKRATCPSCRGAIVVVAAAPVPMAQAGYL